jgi:hypothetical protein
MARVPLGLLGGLTPAASPPTVDAYQDNYLN